MLKSAEYFREEIDEHILRGRCPAQVCRALIRYEIEGDSPNLPEAAAICPTDAIVQGERGWQIDQSRCVKCDACREIAPEAVRVVDAPPAREPAFVRVQDVGLDARGTMQHE
jgi:ferredoxin